MESKPCSSKKCSLPTKVKHGWVVIHKANANNLKNVCLEFPKNQLIALTGLSGSGKSSIAVEVLGNESVRQLLSGYGLVSDHMTKANVGTILGLPAAITISQRVTETNPRSTVGTRTGVLAILRNMFAALGRQKCPNCGYVVKQPTLGKHKLIVTEAKEKNDTAKKKNATFFACQNCDTQIQKLEMAHFSFNSEQGVCHTCKGVGEIIDIHYDALLDPEKSIEQGAIKCWDTSTAQYYLPVLEAASKHYQIKFNKHSLLKDYSSAMRMLLLYGINHPEFKQAHKGIKAPKKVSQGKYEGLITQLLAQIKKQPELTDTVYEDYIIRKLCSECQGTRLSQMGREASIADKTIVDVTHLSLIDLYEWLQGLTSLLDDDEIQTYAAFSDSLMERAYGLIEVGLEYLSLERALPTLSGGESQRLRLAAAIGASALSGILYILDEPTTGLHPSDTEKLLTILRKIQSNDNTIMLIEHDPEVIAQADYIIEVGPGRGKEGGEIVAYGSPEQIKRASNSKIAPHLGMQSLNLSAPKKQSEEFLTVYNACENNLKNIDVRIPLNRLVVFTGVSGSGKSTFLFSILDNIVRKRLNKAACLPGKYSKVEGLEHIDQIVTVNQSTIGSSKSTRSNVATYTKLFDLIRKLFASLSAAKNHQYTVNSFSFNTSEERCENCAGEGVIYIDMSFMPDVEMTCPVCQGQRFNDELLTVRFEGYNISEILCLTVNEAVSVFANQQKIIEVLQLMQRVGLGHLTLGQATSSLSGGEAQRIKLAKELSRANKKHVLYLLDEPTTGLHPDEIEELLTILQELVQHGNSVVLIEHNLQIIANADYIIDFGPKGGSAGGEIVAQGTPQQIYDNPESLTGRSLHSF